MTAPTERKYDLLFYNELRAAGVAPGLALLLARRESPSVRDQGRAQ